MFRAALIRLTLLYLLIIMVISFFFSITLYSVSTAAISTNTGRQQMSIQRIGRGAGLLDNPDFIAERDRIAAEANHNILINLIYTNIAILILGGGLSYFLAGRTLAPIEEAHEAQGRFASDASHELRSPLAAMKTELEVALRDKDLSREEAIALLESNLEEVNRLKALSDGLLALARNGGETATKTVVELGQSITDAISTVQKAADKQKIVITSDISQHQRVWADKAATQELFVILLDNAIKYSEPAKTIHIEASTKGRFAIVKVEDEGIGIAPENLEKVFDRFFRADNSRTKSKTPGYGLGLALARKIAESNGGSIKASTRTTGGSTFTARLPLINS
jgi:signal transduction histidine kinase